MAVCLVAGAALGPVFDFLYHAVINAAQKVAAFRPILNKLKVTMFTIKPIFNDIVKLNKVLQRPQEETDKFIDMLRQGEKLVQKCIKVKYWKFWKKHEYKKKLDNLQEELQWFFQIFVQADTCREIKRVRVGVDELIDLVKGDCMNISPVGFTGFCNLSTSNEFVVGFEVPLQEVKEMLVKDDQVVAISAPGGCGKTTLAKRVCNDDKIKGIYKDNIFFVPVNKTTTWREIVQKIVKSKGVNVPQFQSDDEARIVLENFLKVTCPGPTLVVLDDVQSESESLIEKFVLPIPEYKILLTSRFIFPRFSSTYKLKLLNDEDAMTLFLHSAFKDRTIYVQDNILQKMVRSCGGFPLALTVVGRSLCGRPELEWVERIQKFWESIFTTNISLLHILQSSIDALDGQLKECYLDLALFPKGQKISATTLRDIWVELYNLSEDGAGPVTLLFELYTRNLANLTLAREGAADLFDNCNDHFITQHDLLRELAIHLSSKEPVNQRKRLIMDINGNEIPNYWIDLNQQTFSSQILSISTDKMFSSVWPDIQLPAVEVLLLNFDAETYSVPEFIEGMRNLKVIVITNNGSCAAKLNMPQLDHLEGLKTITLDYISFFSFDWSMPNLRNLKKISMVACKIGEAFENCTHLPSMWPNLMEINIDHCQDLVRLPSELCQLVHLKKMCITYCQELLELPEDIGNLTELQALRIHSCTRLQELPGSVGDLKSLTTLDISDCALIDNITERIGELCSLRVFNMRGCTGLIDIPLEVKELANLELVICDQEMEYFWKTFTSHVRHLRIDVPKEDVNLRWLHKF
ncbi:hypothetical protein LIER_36305 [Lithospermum erythrorhizon]|uniref:RPW8 domain-containing protein n=1 Tax=Lithospermum erythrorhizon TaxID=34254 RepID=A0AAV3P4K1_LITER